MAYSKVERLEKMRIMIVEMGPMLTEATIKDGYLQVPENAEICRSQMVVEAHKWLESIHEGVYRDVMAVRKLLPEELWARYKAWGEDFEEHREVKMLKEKLVIFRKAIVNRSRPDFFKRGKYNAEIKRRTKKSKAKKGGSKEEAEVGASD